jgi:hypothetical protein
MILRRQARNLKWRRALEWLCVIQFHFVVVAGVALVVIGVVKVTGPNPKASDETLMKVGVIIILICWVVLVGWTAFAFLSSGYDRRTPAYAPGTKVNHTSVLNPNFC